MPIAQYAHAFGRFIKEQFQRGHKFAKQQIYSLTNIWLFNKVFYELARQLKSQYDVGNLEASRGDSFRLRYPDTTDISNRWRRCCSYYS
jgi:hypothetical protein